MTALMLSSGRQFKTADALVDYTENLEEQIRFLKQDLGQVSNGEAVSRLIACWGFTPKEALIVEHLAAIKGRIASKQSLMDALYGARDDEPAIKIVDVFICKVRNKMGQDSIVTEWGRGYRLSGEALVEVETVCTTPIALVTKAGKPAPRTRRQNLQSLVLAGFGEGDLMDIPSIAAAAKLSYTHAHNIISCLVKRGRAKPVDWRRMADGKRRVIYAITDAGRTYLRLRTSEE